MFTEVSGNEKQEQNAENNGCIDGATALSYGVRR